MEASQALMPKNMSTPKVALTAPLKATRRMLLHVVTKAMDIPNMSTSCLIKLNSPNHRMNLQNTSDQTKTANDPSRLLKALMGQTAFTTRLSGWVEIIASHS